ncbi:MAG: ParB N-terminal domain-containing protein [Paludisphaera borealis]|uniref:DNA methyltransferase n=1 Tax=Paludisphaera borealis TaxID=1387353 RepID=UPI00284AA05E|nr:DNA methyltransferase [Paludisphaera borealis]MDR3618274.1 ParB N-terminal domain-containing protein [Paludisphaera borealis]
MLSSTRSASVLPIRSASPDESSWDLIEVQDIDRSQFSLSIYGDPDAQTDSLIDGIREHGILDPLVVAPGRVRGRWEVVSGHRRLACACELGFASVPCVIREFATEAERRSAVLEFNRHRRKSFSQLMREADAIEEIWSTDARDRSLSNLKSRPAKPSRSTDWDFQFDDHPSWSDKVESLARDADRRNSDDRQTQPEPAAASKSRGRGRTDSAIAARIGLGGKDLYRQARAVWKKAQEGDARAIAGVAQLDAETKTIHAAYKDLRRRDQFGRDFRPTPYDVWAFRHDRAFGIPYPGSIPPAVVAHALFYFTTPGALVVDPMAGGGTVVDVAQAMGRRCVASDLDPSRPEIRAHDVRQGFLPEAQGCDLVFCDPPYHSMLARKYHKDGVGSAPLDDWTRFLEQLARDAFAALRPGGYFTLLLASQTEKDLPRGFGYIDHTFLGYRAGTDAGFLPERRISCPMNGNYLPQQVRRARVEGRLLGQVRDLLVMRKPHDHHEPASDIPQPQSAVTGLAERPLLKHQDAAACHPSYTITTCQIGICHIGNRQ